MTSLPAAEPVLIDPRLTAAGAAVGIAALLAFLYVYRRKRFILEWTCAWLLVAASLSLHALPVSAEPLPAALPVVSGLLIFWAAAVLLAAPLSIRGLPVTRSATAVATAIGSGLLVAAALLINPADVEVFGYLAAMLLLVWAGALYVRLGRTTSYIGAVVVGAGTLGIAAIAAAGAALAVTIGLSNQAFSRLLAANIATNGIVALGMLLFVLEQLAGELREANTQVTRLAITDPLTGCHNRRFFDEIERGEMERHRRYGTPLSVIFGDVNNFKRLNDTLGHDRGDDLLRALGALLRQHVRESDYVIRWGGDEFLLMLACGEAEAENKALVLKIAFEWQLAAAGFPEDVGLSVGVAGVSDDADGLRDAIRRADKRMYSDKLAGNGGPPEGANI